MDKYTILNSIGEYVYQHPQMTDALELYRAWKLETGYVVSEPEFAALILELIENQKNMPHEVLGELIENERRMKYGT